MRFIKEEERNFRVVGRVAMISSEWEGRKVERLGFE